MNPELTLKITNDSLSILQHMHAAATSDMGAIPIGILFVPILILTFVFPLIVYLTKNEGEKVNMWDHASTISTFIILDIVLGSILYTAGLNYTTEGHYESKEMVVTDVKDIYSDGTKSKYVGSLIFYKEDGETQIIKTFPHDRLTRVRANDNVNAIEMKQGLAKKGDVITVRSPKTYIKNTFPDTILPDTDRAVKPTIHIVEQ